jgi:CRISPR-associated endonuclease/helicase Cas3
LDKEAILEKFSMGSDGLNFAYRSVAEAYRMVKSPQLPVIIPTEESLPAIAQLNEVWSSSGKIARALQPYTVTIPARARDILRETGRGSFHAQALRGDQFFVLDEGSFYHDDIGLWWEGAEALTDDEMNI